MKEFITGTNHKWDFYQRKGEYALLKGKQGDNYEFYFEIIPSVFWEYSFNAKYEEVPKKIDPISDNLYKKLMDKFFCPLKEMDKDSLIEIALKVLNKRPRLMYSTLLGWTNYHDKTQDPNYHGGTYIFPDGNEYTITLKCGKLSVFPGKTDAVPAIALKLPLVSRKINLQQWADKQYKDENIVIEFE